MQAFLQRVHTVDATHRIGWEGGEGSWTTLQKPPKRRRNALNTMFLGQVSSITLGILKKDLWPSRSKYVFFVPVRPRKLTQVRTHWDCKTSYLLRYNGVNKAGTMLIEKSNTDCIRQCHKWKHNETAFTHFSSWAKQRSKMEWTTIRKDLYMWTTWGRFHPIFFKSPLVMNCTGCSHLSKQQSTHSWRLTVNTMLTIS